jgi:uncharacterized membrane protein YphA (DoxX/SURF4 family)
MRRSNKRHYFLALSLLGGVLSPATVFAHVKWFTDEDNYPLRTDLILSDRTLLMLVVAGAAVLGFIFLERLVGDTNWPNLGIFRRMRIGAPTILSLQAAITLVAAASQGTLLVPNLVMPESPVGIVAIGAELFIAVTFITGVWDWAGALTLMALLPVGAIVCGPWDVLEQLMWFGIAATVVVIGRNSSTRWRARQWFARRDPACADHALTLLRVSTGAAFIAVACGEKLWNPELGRAFVVAHPIFNFVQSLGVSWFSDDLFVLMIGLAEATIGALLISGRLTRVVVLGMWLPFHIGIPLLPSQELIGHLPIFGIMYVLLVQPSAAAPTVAEARQPAGAKSFMRLSSVPALRGLALLTFRMH